MSEPGSALGGAPGVETGNCKNSGITERKWKEVELRQAFKKSFKWMKGQTLEKKQGFVDFHSWENYMKGLKPEIVVTKFYK